MIRILEEKEARAAGILNRRQQNPDLARTVAEIIGQVRQKGDEALRLYGGRFDGLSPDTPLEVSRREIDEAYDQLDPALLAVLEKAAENIRDFHSRQQRGGFDYTRPDGARLGMRVTPMAVAGLYIPGGTASYPSTVLMNAIPAKLAGVPSVIMASPATGGQLDPAILAAAKIAGVDRIFRMGGAQAVAALAWGTETVPRADKIVGPGNAFVAEAKRQIFGQAAIDMIAGPSEILIIADESANPKALAADLLAQAEHDRLASAVLLTCSRELADAVASEVEGQLLSLPRAEIARTAIEENGMILLTESIESAINLSNTLAPEHLELCVENPMALLERVENAGSVFLGHYSPEALGDYLAGPNHTLPTMGTARFSSPLSVDDFLKKSSYICYTKEALGALAGDIDLFARREGLEGHARSVTIRFEEGEK